MVRQVRSSVFETNSSSTHSITIGTGEWKIPGHKVVVTFGEFGWEIETYTDFYSRLEYAATFAVNYSDDYINLSLLNEVLEENFDEVLYNVYEEYYNYDEFLEKVENEDFEFGDLGYIDHQSIDDAAEIFYTKSNLENFLFCTDSYFKTDNDNH